MNSNVLKSFVRIKYLGLKAYYPLLSDEGDFLEAERVNKIFTSDLPKGKKETQSDSLWHLSLKLYLQ